MERQSTFSLKKLIIKIIIAVVLVGITVSSFFIVKGLSGSEKEEASNSGESDSSVTEIMYQVTLSLENKESTELFHESYQVKPSQSLYDLLCDHHEVRAEDSVYGKTLYDIDSVKTDFKTSYIAIYVDGKYSNYGISSITIYDGISVSFQETLL